MPGVFLLAPGPVFIDPNQQVVQSNATITSNGSSIFNGFGAKEITLIVNVTASPTGSSPTLQYTLQEVDPGNLTTVFGSSVSSASIVASGVYVTTIRVTYGGALKVSWVVGGGSPSFTGVYATLASKLDAPSLGVDGSGVERAVLVDSTGSPIVVGAGTAGSPSGGVVSVQGVGSGTPVPVSGTVTAPVDTTPATQNITAVDVATTTTAGANGQSIFTGTPTANSAASFTLSSWETAVVQVTGTWAATLTIEISMDGGTTWYTRRVHQAGTDIQASTFTANFSGSAVVGGYTNIRVRCTAFTSGTATVKVLESANPSNVYIGNAVRVTDNAGNYLPALDTAAHKGFVAVTDGTNTATVKAASTAALATDTALVVAISPNNSISATTSGGTKDVNNSTTATLLANATFTGAYTSCIGFDVIHILVQSDQSSASVAGVVVTWDYDGTGTHAFDDGEQQFFYQPSGWEYFPVRIRAPFFRVKYTNGTTNQGSFALATVLKISAPDSTVHIGQGIDTNTGFELPRASLIAGTTGNPSGNATPILVTSTGSQVVEGIGSPGTSTGGVLTVQGDPSGTLVPTKIGSWLGSTAPTVGQKTAANSIPVVLASDAAAPGGYVDPNNSTTTPLGANAIFSGTLTSTSGYDVLFIRIESDQNSATNGVQIIWRSTLSGAAWLDTEQSYSFVPSPSLYQFRIKAPYYAVKYTNGVTLQTTFNLVSVLKVSEPDSTVFPGQNLTTGAGYEQGLRTTLVGGTDGSNARTVLTSTDGNISANRTASATINGPGGATTLLTGGLGNVSAQITGTWTGSILFEGSVDGTNFSTIPVTAIGSAAGASPITATTANGIWSMPVGGLASIRARATALSSGAAVTTLVGTPAVSTFKPVNPAVTLTSPSAGAAGLYAFVSTYGTLRTTGEAAALFNDTFDGTTIETTNKWDVNTSGGGAVAQSGGIVNFTTSTTASAAAALSSKPYFPAAGLSFQNYGFVIKLEASALTNCHRFWGIGTQGSAFSSTNPLTDAIGFEVDTDGILYASVYSNGSATTKIALTKPTDGVEHRYAIVSRADLTLWYQDGIEVPIASASFSHPFNFTLPIRLHLINGSSPPGSGPTFTSSALGAGDSAPNSITLSDGAYPWRKISIKPASTAVAATDSALVVAVSPNTAVIDTPTANAYGTDLLSSILLALEKMIANQDMTNILLMKLVDSAGADIDDDQMDDIDFDDGVIN